LALYHLCSGCPAGQLPGVEALMLEAKIEAIPTNVSRAVLVGHKISPGKPSIKEDGTEVRTLWGELAWQLGGAEGYAMVAEDDRKATNPGDTLRLLFNKYAPCVVLIDEWIRYAAQLHEKSDLPGGSFDTHFTFAQALSEAAKAADRTMLLVSIPASEIEFGGDRGKERTRSAASKRPGGRPVPRKVTKSSDAVCSSRSATRS
jgi:predicted AAA+ superfamily ATPase